MAIPYLIVLSKLSSSLMIFSIRYLLSVWYRIASLAVVFASYPAQMHLSACSLTLTYHSRKQRYLYGIFWNSWNLAIAWFVCCHMLLVTFVSAYTTTKPTWSKKLFMLSLTTSLYIVLAFLDPPQVTWFTLYASFAPVATKMSRKLATDFLKFWCSCFEFLIFLVINDPVINVSWW